MKLPKAKTNNIVIMNLENETLVYDLKSNKAFCLNETATMVYQHCDGTKTFAELSSKHKFSDELIFFALDELKKEQLVETDENYQSPFAQMTRRAVVRKIGLASMITLPLVASVVAPNAVNAASIPCDPFGTVPCNPAGTNVGGCGTASLDFTVCVNYCNNERRVACASLQINPVCAIFPPQPLSPPSSGCACICL